MGIQLASAVLYNNGHVQLYNVQLYNGHVSFRVSEGRLVAFAFESGRINRVGQNCTLHIKRRITYDKAH